MSEYYVDPHRLKVMTSGIVIDAKLGAQDVVADISQLDQLSLLSWLRSFGGRNRLAENVVAATLGYPPFHNNINDNN